jgi:NAD(P)-dependent dehydrogenase (short-subunit alcohol dehydrogenase family)
VDLNGKVAVITGGASGIGLATAKALAAQGCKLVLADVEVAVLDRVVAELGAVTEVVGVPTDVSVKAAVDHLAAITEERFGGADIVFLNAGVGTSLPVVELTHADWEWVLGVDLWGVVHGVEAFLPKLVSAGRGGHLVFTASFAGLVPNVNMGPYCVAKYGVVALAEVLQKELRGTGIGVTVLCPMLVATNVGTSARNRPESLGGPGELADVDAIADPNLAGNIIDPSVIANRVVAAIGTDELYVVTHPESRRSIARRFERIDNAFVTAGLG